MIAKLITGLRVAHHNTLTNVWNLESWLVACMNMNNTLGFGSACKRMSFIRTNGRDHGMEARIPRYDDEALEDLSYS